MMRIWLVLLTLLAVTVTRAEVAVLTEHNNLSHTGANLDEKILNTSNVNTNSFGLLYSRTVDDQIYSQPLIMTNVDVPGKGVHTLVILTTVNNSVYAFDADDASVTEPYWKTSFIHPPKIVPPRRAGGGARGAGGGGGRGGAGGGGSAAAPGSEPV